MTLLSKRLSIVSKMVDQNARLADIGSDHAYLPVELVNNQVINFAIAGEVAEGPRDRSLEDIKKYQLADKIDVRLGDGLAVIKPADKIDTVVIAGMGGILISDILTRATPDQLANVQTLILQPNIGEPLVRQWLIKHHFAIVDEDIVEDEHHIYEIIKANFQNEIEPLSEAEILMGPVLMQKKSMTFAQKWSHKLQNYRNAVTNMQHAKKIDQAKIAQMNDYIKYIEEIL
ncbi:tRNA (adenine(22)-N(1))-methyltransferase [Companilactobacillus furfuricola]|uniref:tRNA (adenine(22)-N(1))-methyltransferase n=1 Tax=Companilactobacillus furfuricola TaxID=1462575 RepID=UPI000F794ED9|nr:class I SAM-dependent methyltransferase [Companilactobacillus furfuricola]